MTDIKSSVVLVGVILFIQSTISDNMSAAVASQEIEPLRSLLSYVLKNHEKNFRNSVPKVKKFTEEDAMESVEVKDNYVKENDEVKHKKKIKRIQDNIVSQKRRVKVPKIKTLIRRTKDMKENTETENEKELREAVEAIDGMDFKIEASEVKEQEAKEAKEQKENRNNLDRDFTENSEPTEKDVNASRQNKPGSEHATIDVFKAVRESEKDSDKHHKHRGKKYWKKKFEKAHVKGHAQASQENSKTKKYKQKIENIAVSSEVLGPNGKDVNVTRKVGLDKPVDIIVHIKMTK